MSFIGVVNIQLSHSLLFVKTIIPQDRKRRCFNHRGRSPRWLKQLTFEIAWDNSFNKQKDCGVIVLSFYIYLQTK